MNLIKGQADGARFTATGQTLLLPSAPPRSGELILGVRPEHTALSRDGAAGWPMKVEALEMLGAERLVYGSVGGVLFTGPLRPPGLAPPGGRDGVAPRAAPPNPHGCRAPRPARLCPRPTGRPALPPWGPPPPPPRARAPQKPLAAFRGGRGPWATARLRVRRQAERRRRAVPAPRLDPGAHDLGQRPRR